MARYRDDDVVDLVVVGAGAGGSVLAQRLARKGWRVVVLEKGPFWDPDRDWVSDEKGSAGLYWTDERVVSGNNPIQMGKNNSGVGVGGSMTHFAGYVPRLHPSDFEVRTRDGVAVDWPISYWDLKPSFERVERELPVAGEHWPWGDPHDYPHAPHPISGAAAVAWEGARKYGIEMRVGPVSITNGVFGNRPHCIYRGFCLEGCKVNAKASPLITHLPDAIEHGCEVRADCMVTRIELDETGRPRDRSRYVSQGRERFQRAAAVAVCGYAIETPRLLLNSACPGHPHGLGNNADQVGRYVMVQGATQIAARFPELLRMYKAPPPEVSSEQFYETDERRGFARGFSIQTVSPLPIGWAEHVLAEGHWGQSLREYMRDYNHWTVLGILAEFMPLPENRVTLAARGRLQRNAGRALQLQPLRERRRDRRLRQQDPARDLGRRRRAGDADDRPPRPPRRRCPHGRKPRRLRRRQEPPRLGHRQPLHRRRLRASDPGGRQPRARDHGARRPRRDPPRAQGGVSANISNPRDLLLLLLGEILYVERRLAGGVLQQLVDACADDELTRGPDRASRPDPAARRTGRDRVSPDRSSTHGEPLDVVRERSRPARRARGLDRRPRSRRRLPRDRGAPDRALGDRLLHGAAPARPGGGL